MAAYVIWDIHGEYEKFNQLLKTIKLKETDTLYILGDVLDRGLYHIKMLLQLMEMSDVICIFGKNDYSDKYFDKTFTITGHTPTQEIKENDKPGYIYIKNNHIAIDCGACYPDGRLAAIRLDNETEYYFN